jgi:AcrR family transcriptional regulator
LLKVVQVDGRRSRWERHKVERREQIVDAAIAILEESPAGTDIHVQQVADRAGVARPVLYRHFDDRADLDRAVQGRVVQLLRAEIEPMVTPDGTIEEIILRIIEAYVRWAAEHPALHDLMEQSGPAAGDPSAVQLAIGDIAQQVQGLITLAVELLGVELGEGEAAALDPLGFGLVGQAFATTRRWATRTPVEPSPQTLARLLARSVWHQIDGHARALGVSLDPSMTLQQLAESGELVSDQG